MKKILSHTNILLWIFTIISIVVIVLIRIFKCYIIHNPCSSMDVDGINDVFVNLAYGYLSGILIYLLTTILTNYIKGIQARKSIQPDINLIVKEFYIILYYFKTKCNSNKEINNLNEDDFKTFKTFSNDKMNFKYWLLENDKITTSSGEYTEIDYFKFIKNETIKIIDNIFMIPFSVFIDDNLILTLRNLKNCQLFRDADGLIVFEIQNFYKHIFEFYIIIKKLKEYSTDFKEICGEITSS
ncbi:MAG: hypothetical protein HW421_3109 [Ignavibacteria bacterium]|nr:hypothetical protein [Ignavibacteria bacterium]